MERCPSARGPNSMRPWNQPMIFPLASSSAAVAATFFKFRRAQLVGHQRFLDFRVAIFGPEICVAHRLHRQASAVIQVRSEYRAQRDAVIGSRGLHKNIVDHARSLNFSVGFGIQRHAACQAHVAAIVFCMRELDQRHHGDFASVLHGKGDIFETVVNFAFGRALGPSRLAIADVPLLRSNSSGALTW